MIRSITKTFRGVAAIALVAVGTVTLLRGTVQAAGIDISPAYLSASINQKQPFQDVAVGIRSSTDVPVQMHVTLGGIDQRSGLFVPTKQLDPGLRSALSISPTEFVLQPRQSLNVKLHFQDEPSLSPGGHYATLIFTQLNDTGQRVGLRSAVSVTLFLTKEGGAVQALDVKTIRAPRSVFSLPEYVDTDFYSSGNVLVVPRASITLVHGSKILAKGVANQQSVPVLPGNTVRLRSSLSSIGSTFWPVRYKLHVTYRFDGSDKSIDKAVSYWYIPPQWGLAVLLLLVTAYHFKWVAWARSKDWKKIYKDCVTWVRTAKKTTERKLKRRKK